MTKETKELINYIFKQYFTNIKEYLYKFAKKNDINNSVLGDFEQYYQQKQDNDIIRIRKRNLQLVHQVVMPEVNNKDLFDKKVIFRALSIQYTVLSALMYRVPFHNKL